MVTPLMYACDPRLTMTIAPAVDFRKLDDFCEMHHIGKEIHDDLKQLVEWDIVFICDDSGSMNEDAGHGKTRWDELKKTVMTEVELATCLDDNGADIYFLNRPALRNVTNVSEITNAFSTNPSGRTPMHRLVTDVMNEKYSASGKRLLIIIATDGEPSDVTQGEFHTLIETRGTNDLGEREVLQDRIRFGFLACTDEKSVMRFLNKMDEKIRGVDVVDDYRSERKEAKDKKHFNRATYVAKALLGPVSQKYDKID